MIMIIIGVIAAGAAIFAAGLLIGRRRTPRRHVLRHDRLDVDRPAASFEIPAGSADGVRDALALSRAALADDQQARDILIRHADVVDVLSGYTILVGALLYAVYGDKSAIRRFLDRATVSEDDDRGEAK